MTKFQISNLKSQMSNGLAQRLLPIALSRRRLDAFQTRLLDSNHVQGQTRTPISRTQYFIHRPQGVICLVLVKLVGGVKWASRSARKSFIPITVSAQSNRLNRSKSEPSRFRSTRYDLPLPIPSFSFPSPMQLK